MTYNVVEAKGSIIRTLSTHETRVKAVKAMNCVSGSIVAVTNPTGRIVATNVARSF